MTTYIDKDALLHKIQERYDVHEDEEGKWLRMNNKEVKCSYCSLIRNITTQEGWRFCPSCGALMLEE